MAGNTPNVSRDSFSVNKLYDKVTLQQDVPVIDSDWNELQDVARMADILNYYYMIGNCRFHVLPEYTTPAGYEIQQTSPTTNDFKITEGWALVYGVLVPTTMEYPPQAHDYDDDTNRMGEGVVTAVGGGKITDSNQNWQSYHNLVDCRVKMTSGAESGNTFTITVVDSNTQVTLSGGTGSIGIDDTFIIKPPALTTPSGADRTDEVYIMVWWEDINENEDGNIVNPGVAVETSHRSQRRWCVRVAEDGVTPSTSSPHDFDPRYLHLATLERLNGNANITTAMIEMEANRVSSWSKFSSIDLPLVRRTSVAGLSSDTKFQLTGTWFCGPSTVINKKYFRLFKDETQDPLQGSDYREIGVADIYDSTDDHVIGIADIEGGYVTDPWIYLDFTDTVDTTYTGNIYVTACEKNIAGYPQHNATVGTPMEQVQNAPHADSIQVGDEGTPGTPEFDRFSWTGPKTLQGALDYLIGAVNNLVIDERTVTSTWQLLWRSDNIRQDSNVDGNTVSIYFKSAGYAIVTGAYINGSAQVVSGTDTDSPVNVLAFDREYLVQCQARPSAASTNIGAITNPSNWAHYNEMYYPPADGGPQQTFYRDVRFAGKLLLMDDSGDTGTIGHITLDNHASSRIQGANLTGDTVRAYFESPAASRSVRCMYQDDALWFLSNIEYDTSGGKDFSMDSVNYDGMALKIETTTAYPSKLTLYYVHSSAGSPQADWYMSEWYKFAVHQWGENTGSANLAEHFESVADTEINNLNKIIHPAIVMVRNMSSGNSAVYSFSNGLVTMLQGDSGFSHTKDTADTINVYYDTQFRVQNEIAATIDIKVAAFGMLHLAS
jgi:hypothetical protein